MPYKIKASPTGKVGEDGQGYSVTMQLTLKDKIPIFTKGIHITARLCDNHWYARRSDQADPVFIEDKGLEHKLEKKMKQLAEEIGKKEDK